MIEAGEALTVTLGIMAVAWMKSVSSKSAALEDWQTAFDTRGVSQGHWHSILDAARSELADREEPYPGLTSALRRGRGGVGLVQDLQVLLEERNRWAHGARPRTSVEAGMRLATLAPALEGAAERVSLITDSEWLLIDSNSMTRGGTFNVSAQRVMSDHPEFERVRFSNANALVDHDVYVRTNQGYLNLTPLAVLRDCETCRQPELCYADRVDKRNGIALKSFTTGHVIFDRELADDLGAGPSSQQSAG